MKPARFILACLACVAAMASSAVMAQPRVEPEINFKSIEPVTEPAQVAEWLQRLVGHYKYDGMIQMGDCVSLETEEGGGPLPPANDNCVTIKGKSDCIPVGTGPGVQCILNVTWLDIFEPGAMHAKLASYLDPAMELYGLDPADLAVSRLIVNNKGIAEAGPGYIKGNTATFWSPCANSDTVSCFRIVRIEARPDSKLIWMWFSTRVDPEPESTYAVMTLRRMTVAQAASMDARLKNVISAAEETEEEIARVKEDARQESETLALDPPATTVAQDAGQSQPTLHELDEAVAESERERRREAQSPRRISNPDAVTVTRTSTRAGNGSIRARVQPYTPQREIRFRASNARQLAEGANPRLELHRDRLTTDNESRIRSATLEFTAGKEESDGLPAVIPINATTSLFNFDYVRPGESTQPPMVTLRNVMHPETRRCTSALRLSDGGDDFQSRFVLLGDTFGDCNRTVNSREGDLVFADAVPQRLRQELHDLYDPVYSRFAGDLGSEPGIVFVIWRPESSGNDFRLVRSLNRTSLLVFNGPSWEHGFTAQHRNVLWEDLAQEQIQRRIRGGEAFTEAAADYLLKLARAQRQQTTSRWLTNEVPEWITACARTMSLRASATNAPRGIFSYDCGLVVQFVYDAVARAKSNGEDSVMSTWRALLADSYRRRQDGVSSSAFLDSSADARRIVQVLLSGVVDWPAFAGELGKIGVQLRVTPGGPLALSVQVQSLAEFRD